MSALNAVACVFAAVALAMSTAAIDPSQPDITVVQLLNGTSGPRGQLCGVKPCIRKCCKARQIAYMEGTELDSGNCKSKDRFEESNIKDLSFENAKIPMPGPNANIGSAFVVLVDDQKHITKTGHAYLEMNDYYVNTDGKLYTKNNQQVQWNIYDPDNFCLDHVLLLSKEVVIRPFVWYESVAPERINGINSNSNVLHACRNVVYMIAFVKLFDVLYSQ